MMPFRQRVRSGTLIRAPMVGMETNREPTDRGEPPHFSPEVSRQIREGVIHALGRCAACVRSDGGDNLFSGVYVRFRDRPFLLTAAHCLKDVRDRESLQLVFDDPPRRSGPVFGRGTKDEDRYDMGILELDPGFAASLPVDWIVEAQMYSDCVAPGQLLIVRGSVVCAAHVPDGMILFPRDAIFETRMLDRQVSGVTPPIGAEDLLLEFDPEQFERPWVAGSTPRGLSGAGVFALLEPRDGEVWDPRKHIHLVGIQSAALTKQARCLRAKRIDVARRVLGDWSEHP